MKTIAKVIESMLTDATSSPPTAPPHSPFTRRPPRKGMIMKTIAKVIESMLTKDATQQWTGQTSAVAPCNIWSWTGFSD